MVRGRAVIVENQEHNILQTCNLCVKIFESGRTKTKHKSLILITLQVLYRMYQAKAMFQECNNEYIKPRGEQR